MLTHAADVNRNCVLDILDMPYQHVDALEGTPKFVAIFHLHFVWINFIQPSWS